MTYDKGAADDLITINAINSRQACDGLNCVCSDRMKSSAAGMSVGNPGNHSCYTLREGGLVQSGEPAHFLPPVTAWYRYPAGCMHCQSSDILRRHMARLQEHIHPLA